MGDTETCGPRYLTSKKTVDDRALNHAVMASLRNEAAALAADRGAQPLRVLEIGAGIGTMVARLADNGVISRAQYQLCDVDPRLLREARGWLLAWASERGLATGSQGDTLRLSSTQGPEVDLSVSFLPMELGQLLERRGGLPPVDVVIANAFLDLVDVPTILPPLFELLVADGLGFFTINFDGETIFLPEQPGDEACIGAYHRSMDQRVRFGRPAGESKAGRRLFGHLRAAGATVLAAGSSDWVVHAGPDGYPADEGFFLHTILDTVEEALGARREIEPALLMEWMQQRRLQVETGELVYIAHQLDYLVRRPPATSEGGK